MLYDSDENQLGGGRNLRKRGVVPLAALDSPKLNEQPPPIIPGAEIKENKQSSGAAGQKKGRGTKKPKAASKK